VRNLDQDRLSLDDPAHVLTQDGILDRGDPVGPAVVACPDAALEKINESSAAHGHPPGTQPKTRMKMSGRGATSSSII
jgi:hypothetical protein